VKEFIISTALPNGKNRQSMTSRIWFGRRRVFKMLIEVSDLVSNSIFDHIFSFIRIMSELEECDHGRSIVKTIFLAYTCFSTSINS
jgi:hypothetical protein